MLLTLFFLICFMKLKLRPEFRKSYFIFYLLNREIIKRFEIGFFFQDIIGRVMSKGFHPLALGIFGHHLSHTK